MRRPEQDRRLGDAGLLRDRLADIADSLAMHPQGIEADEGDAVLAIIEDSSSHLARVVKRAVVGLAIAAGRPVDQPRRERIAGTETIHVLDLVSPRSQDAAFLPGDGGPVILPDQRVLAQRDRHHLDGKTAGYLGGDVLVVLALDADDSL